MTQRLLQAIMFTDIVGYTTLMQSDEGNALNILRINRKLHQTCIATQNGHLVKELGDGFLVRFNSAKEAVLCAQQLQMQVLCENYQLRIGIHLGDVTIENNDIFGDGVNIASRIQAMAEPGNTYISESVRNAIKSINEIKTRFIGRLQLKNVTEYLQTYAVVPDQSSVTPSPVHREHEQSKRIALAVMPFKSLAGDQIQQYILDGMHSAMIGELAQISTLRVISRISTTRYRDSTLTVPEIASELGIDWLVEATVLHADVTAHLQVQLIRAFPEEDHVWVGTYNKEMKDIYSLYRYVVKDITDNLQSKLTPSETKHLNTVYEVKPVAYNLYLRGLYQWEKLTADGLKNALAYFEQAAELDPKFASVYSAIAGVWLGSMAMGLVLPSDCIMKIYRNIEKTKSLDPNNADACFWNASLSVWFEHDWQKARSEYENVLAINPNHSVALAYYAHFLLIIGERDESDEKMQRAVQLDLFNPLILSMYAMQLNFTRRYDKAIDVVNKVLGENEHHPIAYSTLRTLYHNKQLYDEAYDKFRLSHQVKGDVEAIAALQQGYQQGGYSGALQELAALLLARSKKTYIPDWQIATLYTRAGLKDKALKYLNRAMKARDPNVVYIRVDPIFDVLIEEPGFQDLLNKMHLPQFVHSLNSSDDEHTGNNLAT